MSGMQLHELLQSMGNNVAGSGLPDAKKQAETLAEAKSWAWNVPGNVLVGIGLNNPAIPITYPEARPAPIPQIVTTFGTLRAGTSFRSLGELVSKTMNITFTTNELEGDDMLLEANRDLPKLRTSYEFDNEEEIYSFVRRNPYVMSALLDAPLSISGRFEDSPLLALEVFTDPDEGYEQLFLLIRTTLAADDAQQRLDALYDDWWLDIVPSMKHKMAIDIELA